MRASPLLVVAAIGVGVVVAVSRDDVSDGASPATATTASPPAGTDQHLTGTLPADIAVSEWGTVEIDGVPLDRYPDFGLDPATGDPMPRIVGSTFTGQPVTLQPGRSLLITVMAHWCIVCRASLDALDTWLGSPHPDIDVVVISSQVKPNQDNYPPSSFFGVDRHPYPVMADTEDSAAAKALGFDGIPFTLAIASDGTVIERFEGELTLGVLYSEITADLFRRDTTG